MPSLCNQTCATDIATKHPRKVLKSMILAVPRLSLRGTGLRPVVVFRLQSILSAVHFDDGGVRERRTGKNIAAKEHHKHALVPDFLAKHASRRDVHPT